MATATTAAFTGRRWATCARKAPRWAAVVALALYGAVPVWAAPPVSTMLKFKPVQDGVPYSTPDADRLADCKVELVQGRGKGSGWVLRDPDGKPLRLFFDSDGMRKPNVWSYYRDGLEVYREIDTGYAGKPDQFRWFNSGGSRLGIDADRDGRIETWKVISPEEASQEVLAAVATKDFQRFKAVLITEAELKSLDLSAEASARIRDGLAHVEDKFNEACAKISAAGVRPNWIHLETAAPQCIPAANGGHEVFRQPRGTILYEANGKNDWLQTGEMIQVGLAWRVTDAPAPGAGMVESEITGRGGKGGLNLPDNPRVAKLIEELTGIDKAFTEKNDTSAAAVSAHHLRRADILEHIVAEVKPEDRDPWIRQVADSLGTAAQNNAENGLSRLAGLEQQLATAMPGQNLTAYVTFREMQATYARKASAGGAQFAQVQQEWLDRLGKFISTYPKADDTPDALLQCGMVSEFLNKEVEAKNWYSQLAKAFPDKPQAVKALGAARRLELEGKPFQLTGPLLNDANTNFDIGQTAGKVVIVYYWASWNSQSVGDFAKMKLLLDQVAGKAELVCVNLDGTPAEASDFLKRSPAPGTQIYQAGGLESKLATDYGVMVLPNMFLIGKDGKVASKNVQINTLDEEVKKLLK